MFPSSAVTKAIFSLDEWRPLPRKSRPHTRHPDVVPEICKKLEKQNRHPRRKKKVNFCIQKPKWMDTSWLPTTYDLAMCAICKELVLRISGSPQRKKFLDNFTFPVF